METIERGRTYTLGPPLEACGLPVTDEAGSLLGFCARGVNHDGVPCTHLMSAFEVWWK